MRAELAPLVPPQLFRSQPADALHVATLYLAEIDRRVQRVAAVVQDVGAQDAVLAGQRVDDHLGHCRAVGEVVERPAAERRAVVADLGRAVEAGRRQRNACGPGGLYELVEFEDALGDVDFAAAEVDFGLGHRVLACGERRQALADLRGRFLCGLAVHIGAARCGRGRGIRHLAGVGRRGSHLVDRDAEFVGHHLRHLGEQALPHLGAAVVELHGAVAIHVHERAGLVQQRRGE